MRLTCPKCSAQYEVPDNVIPPEGRDVQCSNCDQSWFQEARAEPDPAVETVAPAEDGPTSPDAAEADSAPAPADEDSSEDTAPEVGGDTTGPDGPRPAGPVHREIDPAILTILREEAEHEAKLRESDLDARIQESEGVYAAAMPTDADNGATFDETQDDPNDDADLPGSESFADTLAGSPEPEEAEDPDDAPGPGDDGANLQPDANSEFGPSEQQSGDDEDISRDNDDEDDLDEERIDLIAAASQNQGRSGFALGFGLIVLLAAGAVFAYSKAGDISAAVPSAEPSLNAYVVAVDQGRVWLNDQVTSLLAN